MPLYRRPETALWYYEFRVNGQRYRGSTKTADRTEAQAFEDARRLEATQATAQRKANAEDEVQDAALWNVAQSWMTATRDTHADHKGNASRVRKLFGREMRLIGDAWTEVAGGRYGLPMDTKVREVTREVLESLRTAREREGNSGETIGREMSLVRVLLAHAVTCPKLGEGVPTKAKRIPRGGARLSAQDKMSIQTMARGLTDELQRWVESQVRVSDARMHQARILLLDSEDQRESARPILLASIVLYGKADAPRYRVLDDSDEQVLSLPAFRDLGRATRAAKAVALSTWGRRCSAP